jgi:hypothetical protein
VYLLYIYVVTQTPPSSSSSNNLTDTIATVFRTLDSLDLLEIDFEQFRENGFPRGTSLQTIFKSDFPEKCNRIFYNEDEN